MTTVRPDPDSVEEPREDYDGDLMDLIPAQRDGDDAKFHPLTASFLFFHEANPHILDAIITEMRVLWQAGVRRCGIATVYEVVRWRLTINEAAEMARVGDVAPDRTFSMSNNHRAYYVRLLEHLYPGVVGFFDKQKTSEAENDRERWLPVAVRITREAQS